MSYQQTILITMSYKQTILIIIAYTQTILIILSYTDHPLLLDKLQLYGFTDDSLNWMRMGEAKLFT